MKVKLTDRFCANVKSATRMEYFDESTTGLALRVTENGSKSWTFNYTLGDKRSRMTLGTYPALSLAGARTKAIEARTAVETGTDPRLTAVGAETFQAICEDYQAREGKKLRTAEWRKAILKRLVYPTLGQRPIADIRRSEIVRLLDKIEDNNGPVMADRTLTIKCPFRGGFSRPNSGTFFPRRDFGNSASYDLWMLREISFNRAAEVVGCD